MIVNDDLIITAVIVVAVVVRGVLQSSRFFLAPSTDVVDGWVLENLFALVFRQILDLGALQDSCTRCQYGP